MSFIFISRGILSLLVHVKSKVSRAASRRIEFRVDHVGVNVRGPYAGAPACV